MTWEWEAEATDYLDPILRPVLLYPDGVGWRLTARTYASSTAAAKLLGPYSNVRMQMWPTISCGN